VPAEQAIRQRTSWRAKCHSPALGRGDAHGAPLPMSSALQASRARVRDVANMLNAGGEPQVAADEHAVSIEEVRTAAASSSATPPDSRPEFRGLNFVTSTPEQAE
jgi:hypothetical protein